MVSASSGYEHPQPLPHLQINLLPLIQDPSVSGLLQANSRTIIKSVHLSHNAQHCAVVLLSEEIFFFAFSQRKDPPSLLLVMDEGGPDGEQDIVIALNDLGKKDADGYWPRCLLDPRHGTMTAIALSDEGEVSETFEEIGSAYRIGFFL